MRFFRHGRCGLQPRSCHAIAAGILLAPLLSFLALSDPASAGPPVTLGTMQFEAPDPATGWTVKLAKGGMLFQKAFAPNEDNGRKGNAIIQVFGPVAAPPASLDGNFEAIAGTVEGMADERPMLKSDGATTNGHRIRTDYRCCSELKGLSVGQRTVGIASATNQVILALVTLELRGKAGKSAEADFAALVRSLKLEPGDKSFELVPQSGDGGLDGVYTHLETGIRPNPFGGTDFYSDSTITVFDPSGVYATELPPGGDIKAFCREEPTDCGLYALKGGGLLSEPNALEMRAVADEFGTIEADTKPFARDGEDLTIDAGAFKRLPPFQAGTQFEGTWRYFFASSGAGASSSGSVSAERFLVMARDGTFRRSGWAGGSGSTDTGEGTTGFTTGGAQPATNGRYRVEGYALELNGADGKTERLSIFAPDKDSDKLLVIDGANYLKQE